MLTIQETQNNRVCKGSSNRAGGNVNTRRTVVINILVEKNKFLLNWKIEIETHSICYIAGLQ